jgi:hypothetical protein
MATETENMLPDPEEIRSAARTLHKIRQHLLDQLPFGTNKQTVTLWEAECALEGLILVSRVQHEQAKTPLELARVQNL